MNQTINILVSMALTAIFLFFGLAAPGLVVATVVMLLVRAREDMLGLSRGVHIHTWMFLLSAGGLLVVLPAYVAAYLANPAIGGGTLLSYPATGAPFLYGAMWFFYKAIAPGTKASLRLICLCVLVSTGIAVWTLWRFLQLTGIAQVAYIYVVFSVLTVVLVYLWRLALFATPPHPLTTRYLAIGILLIIISAGVMLAEFSYDVAWKKSHPYQNSLPLPARRTGLARAYGTTASRNETGILHAKN